MDEIWRDIPGYENKYQASNLGRIKSLYRLVPHRSRTGTWHTRPVPERILRPSGSKGAPHLYVQLGHRVNGSPVHQLVLKAFVGFAPLNMEVRHLDGNPLNNRLDNLQYGTRTENILDVYRIGGKWRKLTLNQALAIRKTPVFKGSGAALARQYGVSQSCISNIRKGLNYGWAL